MGFSTFPGEVCFSGESRIECSWPGVLCVLDGGLIASFEEDGDSLALHVTPLCLPPSFVNGFGVAKIPWVLFPPFGGLGCVSVGFPAVSGSGIPPLCFCACRLCGSVRGSVGEGFLLRVLGMASHTPQLKK